MTATVGQVAALAVAAVRLAATRSAAALPDQQAACMTVLAPLLS